MSVPTYDKFKEPILRYIASRSGGAAAKDVHDAAAVALELCDDERQELLPSGMQLVYKNRAGWAHDRLKRAGLSSSPRRGFQVLRRTNARLSRKASIDDKVAADQRGNGLGVSLEVYSQSDLEQKIEAVKRLESEVISNDCGDSGAAGNRVTTRSASVQKKTE